MRSGDVIWNPLSGEKALLVESAEESDGSRIVVDFAVEAGGFVPGGEHVHDNCAEHFEVQEGSITFLLDGEERTLAAGDEATVTPGTWHTNAEGRPSPLFGALMASRYRAELRYRQPPDAVQRLMVPPLAAIARRRGLERTLDRYLDLQAHPSAEPAMARLPERVMWEQGRRG